MSTELQVVQPDSAASVLEVIGRATKDPGIDVAKMTALFDLQERMMRLSAERQFNADLVALQAEVPRVTKEGRILNKGTVMSTYARYEDIDRAVRPLMQKYGFAVSFDNPKLAGGAMEFTATLRHRAGHKDDYRLSLPVDSSGAKNGTQGGGSTSSYAKRYLLCGILNIVTEGEDNDAATDPPLNAEQIMQIEQLMSDKKVPLVRILNWQNAESLDAIPGSRFEQVMTALRKAK